MKRFALVFACFALCVGALKAHAQVVYSAKRPARSLIVGGIGSMFQPDYAGNFTPQQAPNRLFGPGLFVDFKMTRWVQLEGEIRWLRYNQYLDINQDTYLVGPRVPIYETRHFKPYAKVLAGYARMNFQNNYAYGHFADIALGGGVDVPLTRRISVRAIDFEYQLWPNWVNGTLKPYGGSVGISYKIF